MNSAADAALEEMLDALHFGVYQLWSQKDIAFLICIRVRGLLRFFSGSCLICSMAKSTGR